MLGKHRGPGGRGNLNTTYVALIIVAAVLIAGAFLILSGSTRNTEGQLHSVPVATTNSAGFAATQKSPASKTTPNPASIAVPTTVSIPSTGTFIRVQYLGSYTGSYVADGGVHKIQSSGDRLFTVANSSQTVSVTVKKSDRSTKQTLTAGIWKNGKLLNSANTTALFGEVSVSAAV